MCGRRDSLNHKSSKKNPKLHRGIQVLWSKKYGTFHYLITLSSMYIYLAYVETVFKQLACEIPVSFLEQKIAFHLHYWENKQGTSTVFLWFCLIYCFIFLKLAEALHPSKHSSVSSCSTKYNLISNSSINEITNQCIAQVFLYFRDGVLGFILLKISAHRNPSNYPVISFFNFPKNTLWNSLA